MNKHNLITLLLLSTILNLACHRKMDFNSLSQGESLASNNPSNLEVNLDSGATNTSIGNENIAIRNLKPALAVRGAACLTCHAQISANIITDFGYGGDGKNFNYFGGRGNADDVYGDFKNEFETSWQSMQFTNSKLQITVPKTSEFNSKSSLNATSLKDYLGQQRSYAEINEVNSVFIGAPSEDRFKEIFSTTGSYTFLPQGQTAISGLSLNSKGFLQLSGDAVCEGDLFVEKPLFITNLKLTSKNGCRIYANKSVFIQGKIQYPNLSESTNLQITSSRAIILGFNLTSLNTRFERGTEFFTRTTMSETGNSIQEKIVNQNNKIISDAQLIAGLKDALEYPYDGSRIIDYSRLLLNAPQIHSRYLGTFTGVIIAEVAILSLGEFAYQFDTVFSKASILPKIAASDYLFINN